MEKNIPTLRFPEFTGEWEEKKLGEIADKVNSGKTPLGGESVYSESGILFIRSQNVNNDSLELDNSTFIPEKINDGMKNSVVKPNDILLNITGASLGRSCVVPANFTIGNVNQHVCIIRLKETNNPRFVQPILSSIKGQNIFQSLQTGSGREGLNSESIKSIKLLFPSLPEQTKIASFLTAVDTKISQLKKKKELLEQYKKGVMQKIFNCELRFTNDDGTAFPKWEKKKIKDVFRFKQGVQCGVESQYSEKGDNMQRFIRIIDLTSSNEPIRYIVSPGVEHHIKPDDLFMVRYGTPGLVGYGYEGIIANNLFRIIPVKKIINKFYYFVFNYLNQELSNLASSSTMPALSFGSLEVLSVPEPSLPEQTKIANFLSAIDEKISHCGLQIEKMEVWKKGLLQGMFV